MPPISRGGRGPAARAGPPRIQTFLSRSRDHSAGLPRRRQDAGHAGRRTGFRCRSCSTRRGAWCGSTPGTRRSPSRISGSRCSGCWPKGRNREGSEMRRVLDCRVLCCSWPRRWAFAQGTPNTIELTPTVGYWFGDTISQGTDRRRSTSTSPSTTRTVVRSPGRLPLHPELGGRRVPGPASAPTSSPGTASSSAARTRSDGWT